MQEFIAALFMVGIVSVGVHIGYSCGLDDGYNHGYNDRILYEELIK